MTDQVRIFDQGYRRYDGARRGIRGSMTTVARHSMQRALGLKRSFWQKILPTLAATIAYLPAIVFVGLSVLIPDALIEHPEDASYAEYYLFISAAIVLFAGFVGPEVLCTDRRTGMLGVYLSSPLTRDTYLAAKAIGIAALLMIVTVGPVLLLLVGYSLEGYGPDGPLAYVWLLVRILVSGASIALIYTSLIVAVSSTTTRRAAASAAIILILIGSSVLSGALTAAGASDELMLLNLLALPIDLVFRIYGEDLEPDTPTQLSTAAVVAAYMAWTLAFAAFARFRYQRLDVSR